MTGRVSLSYLEQLGISVPQVKISVNTVQTITIVLGFIFSLPVCVRFLQIHLYVSRQIPQQKTLNISYFRTDLGVT